MEFSVLCVYKLMYDLSILKTPLLYLLLFLPFLSFSQVKPCKASLRANRGHLLSMMDYLQTEASRFTFGDKSVHIQYRAGDDSVYIYRQKQLFSAFTISGHEITSSYYEYDTDKHYIMLSDSINLQKGRHQKTYPLFASNHVVLSKTFYSNKQPAVCIYYSLRNGRDSVKKEWHRNGLPKQLLVYGMQGRNLWDSLRMAWDSTGILRESQDNSSSAMYYPNGILQTKSLHAKPGIATYYNEAGILETLFYDTLISGIPSRFQKTFYPTGILKTVEYYCMGTPCLTWRIYSPEGMLKQNIHKGPLVRGPNETESGFDEPPPEIFTFAEEPAKFPGGDSPFREYMKTALANLLCKSDVALKGSYDLHFYIDTNGRPVFSAIEGQNAKRLRGLFSALFDSMPRWKAAKQQGLNVQQYFVITLKVEEKKR